VTVAGAVTEFVQGHYSTAAAAVAVAAAAVDVVVADC